MYKNNLTNISSLNKISTTESIKSGKKSNYNSKIISDYSQNISLSSSKILSNSKSRKDYNENNESVLLTSIFNLPKISSSHKFLNHDLPRKNQIRLRKRNNILLLDENNKYINTNISNENSIDCSLIRVEKNPSQKKKKRDYLSERIERALKHKFYSDIEEKYPKNKEENSYNFNERMIHMKKISSFWNGLCNYMNPIFSTEKYKMRKDLNKRNSNLTQNLKENHSLKEKSKLPRIYTNSMVSNYLYNKRKLEEKQFYNKINSKKEYEFY